MSEQHQFLEVIDRDEAEQRFQSALALAPLGVETVPLDEALGRVLGREIVAAVNVPSFDRSNYDGFAVQAADTVGAQEESPRPFTLIAEHLDAGVVPRSAVTRGTAMPIATGGMLPRGADAVVMVEHSDVATDGCLNVRRAVPAGFGVSFTATDISAGEIVLRAGELLTSRATGVLAAIGVTSVDVYRRPRVAILSTGNEIIAPGEAMQPGLVYDSNARILADAVRELGGIPTSLGIVGDELPTLRVKLQQALEANDVVLLSGGTSKGQGDVSYRVLAEFSDPGIVAHGVALKPGKPICLAVTSGRPVVILPGFPTSAIFTFHEFVAPIIRLLGGRPPHDRATQSARLAVRVNSEIGRTEYVLVGLVERAAGPQPVESAGQPDLVAYPMGKGSGSVTTFSHADGFLTIGRHEEILPADTRVDVQLLGDGFRPADLVVIGSHCVGLDYLLGRLHAQGWKTRFLAAGSSAGLAAARRGECDLAGIHLLDPSTGVYNRPFLDDSLLLIAGYRRRQGIVHRAGDRRFEGLLPQAAVSAARSDPTCVMINRNQGSGTRILIERMLSSAAGAAPLAGYAVQVSNHHAVAAAIRQRRADWGVAIETIALGGGDSNDETLGFIHVEDEQYDFVVPQVRRTRPAVEAFCQLLEDATVVRDLEGLEFRRS